MRIFFEVDLNFEFEKARQPFETMYIYVLEQFFGTRFVYWSQTVRKLLDFLFTLEYDGQQGDFIFLLQLFLFA